MAVQLNPFAEAARNWVADTLSLPAGDFVVGTPPKPEMGDLAIGCFPAAKALKKAPPAVAAELAERFVATDSLESATAAGPFINFRLKRSAVLSYLLTCTQGRESLLPTEVGTGKTVCIDFSSPNISKQLAYHHIRSTVIGHALVKLNRAIGYRVIGINHLGDWGTTHGMLLAAFDRWPPQGKIDITALNELYVKYREAMKEDPALEAEGRDYFARLEEGDPELRARWQSFKDISWEEFDSAYKLLGIEFDEVKGESEFVQDVPKVLAILEEKGLSSMSDGALVVDLEEDGMPPLLLRKQDGSTLYGTRDVAAAMYRWEEYAFERNLYVVDRGQGMHFKQLFRTLEKAGFAWSAKCEHVPFGLVRLGGKKTSTRDRKNTVLLKEVFAEAQERVAKRIVENNADWSQEQIDKTSGIVGIGAVVFANLVSQRDKDVDFEWEDVLSTSGDSGAYVQYAHARCCRTLDKGEWKSDSTIDFSLLQSDFEWNVALKILGFGEATHRSANSSEPHILARYLLDLVSAFSGWYTAGNQDKSLRVLCEDPDLQNSRLALVAITRDVLSQGLALLGIDAPEAM